MAIILFAHNFINDKDFENFILFFLPLGAKSYSSQGLHDPLAQQDKDQSGYVTEQSGRAQLGSRTMQGV